MFNHLVHLDLSQQLRTGNIVRVLELIDLYANTSIGPEDSAWADQSHRQPGAKKWFDVQVIYAFAHSRHQRQFRLWCELQGFKVSLT